MVKNKFDLNQGITGKYSILKVFHHPKKTDSFLNGKTSAPVCVRFKPTNRCDHNCFYCVYESSFSGIHQNMSRFNELSREKVMEVLDNLKEMGVLSVTYSGGGEPLLHPNITEALRKTLDLGIGLSMITNGSNLSDENAELLARANWVRVSIDYCDAEMMEKIRGQGVQKFEQTAMNLRNFADKKEENCDFEANCVIHEHNFNRLYDIAKFLKGLGIENVRFAPCWSPEFEKYHSGLKEVVAEQITLAKQLADENFKVGSTYEKYFSTNADPSERPERCYWMQVVPVIAADYNVYPCHNKAYDPDAIIGSIMNKSFKELWFSEETSKFFKEFNPKNSCNHECSSHERNVLIGEWVSCVDPKLNRYP